MQHPIESRAPFELSLTKSKTKKNLISRTNSLGHTVLSVTVKNFVRIQGINAKTHIQSDAEFPDSPLKELSNDISSFHVTQVLPTTQFF